MKRSLIGIPVILLMLLNACGNPGTPAGGTFITFTPTITSPPTSSPESSRIVAYLSGVIRETEAATPLDELEQTIGARYQVLDVTFPLDKDGNPIFQVKINCECAGNGQCCSYQQTFVKTIRAMYVNQAEIIPLVPDSTQYMNVFCYDHLSQYVVIYVLWDDVKKFFSGQLTGSQLASRVSHN
jgi:hypothetical protein